MKFLQEVSYYKLPFINTHVGYALLRGTFQVIGLVALLLFAHLTGFVYRF